MSFSIWADMSTLIGMLACFAVEVTCCGAGVSVFALAVLCGLVEVWVTVVGAVETGLDSSLLF